MNGTVERADGGASRGSCEHAAGGGTGGGGSTDIDRLRSLAAWIGADGGSCEHAAGGGGSTEIDRLRSLAAWIGADGGSCEHAAGGGGSTEIDRLRSLAAWIGADGGSFEQDLLRSFAAFMRIAYDCWGACGFSCVFEELSASRVETPPPCSEASAMAPLSTPHFDLGGLGRVPSAPLCSAWLRVGDLVRKLVSAADLLVLPPSCSRKENESSGRAMAGRAAGVVRGVVRGVTRGVARGASRGVALGVPACADAA